MVCDRLTDDRRLFYLTFIQRTFNVAVLTGVLIGKYFVSVCEASTVFEACRPTRMQDVVGWA